MDHTKRHSLSRSRPHPRLAHTLQPRAGEGGDEGQNPLPKSAKFPNEPTARAKALQRAPSCYNLLQIATTQTLFFAPFVPFVDSSLIYPRVGGVLTR